MFHPAQPAARELPRSVVPAARLERQVFPPRASRHADIEHSSSLGWITSCCSIPVDSGPSRRCRRLVPYRVAEGLVHTHGVPVASQSRGAASRAP